MQGAIDFSLSDYIRLYTVLIFLLLVFASVIYFLKKRTNLSATFSNSDRVSVISRGSLDFKVGYYVISVNEEKYFVLASSNAFAIEKIKVSGVCGS